MFENESLSFEEQTIIQAAARYVQQELANEASGHDWWHIYRVTQLAKTIEIGRASCREREFDGV